MSNELCFIVFGSNKATAQDEARTKSEEKTSSGWEFEKLYLLSVWEAE